MSSKNNILHKRISQSSQPALANKWTVLILLSLAELLAMGTWFSASTVVPTLSLAWGLNDAGRAWLTMSVQAGFVVGSVASALLNLADRIPSRRLFSGTAFLAALCTGLIPLAANGLALALVLRFLTGLFLTGVYPIGMKIMATWTKADRGLGIGMLVGALTLGTAFPHLLNVLTGMDNWRQVLFFGALFAGVGGLIGALFVREGPYQTSAPPFNWRYSWEVLRDRSLRLVIFGYLGHMWELFAMWAWLAAFLIASFNISGISPTWASLTAFSAIAAGGLGSLLAGRLADRFGRTRITMVSMGISGSCALLVGFLFGGNPILLVALCLIWGFAVVADSAQFSTAISELCKKGYIGTALTVQTSLGFLLTMITIRLIPTLESNLGWSWAFAFLALGPAIGIWAMYSLRRSPAAVKMAGGRK
ncbi:MAG: MFS transporter [Anaerolineales bacterium]|jgi:MFS family permease